MPTIMVPRLSSGAIQQILNWEKIPEAVVVQVLGYKKVPAPGADCYRLLISDGTKFCPDVLLGAELNHMITSKELEKFTVVRIEECICGWTSDERKRIVLLSITVLAPGAEVCELIGFLHSGTTLSNNGKVSHHSLGDTSSANGFARQIPHVSKLADNATNVCLISSLTPSQKEWTVQVRVTSKTPASTWCDPQSKVEFFSVNFSDESGEIYAIVIDGSVGKLYDMLAVNKVYYVSKADLVTCKKKHLCIKNLYEMILNNQSSIIPCEVNISCIPRLRFNFVPFQEIKNLKIGASLDVIGVCTSATDVIVQTITTRNLQQKITKRDILLIDDTNVEISLTLWNEDATEFNHSPYSVVVVKGATVLKRGVQTLSLQVGSTVCINPEIKEARVLKSWYDGESAMPYLSSLFCVSSENKKRKVQKKRNCM